ncbi:MAG: type II toxin-antitoxin system HicB family antitoxin [bacterium]|nr:type II toxin-antitoxin system HicB family antitoxin [bacterium]
MAKHEYTAVFKKRGKWIAAWIEEIPGVNTQGRTMKEARENLREALALIIEENRRLSADKYYDAHRERLTIVAA